MSPCLNLNQGTVIPIHDELKHFKLKYTAYPNVVIKMKADNSSTAITAQSNIIYQVHSLTSKVIASLPC